MNLQETIKRVLREERNTKEKIIDLINRSNIYQASRMLGISLTQLVKISDVPINSEIANEILIENMRKGNIIDNYKEFKIHESLDGIFYWEANIRSDHFLNDRVGQITIAATPFWDGLDYTPVELDLFTLYDKNMVNKITELQNTGGFFHRFNHQTNFETVEELYLWFDEVYLPGVYDIIMNKILPKVYKIIDQRLN
jgi:hypothetical protein